MSVWLSLGGFEDDGTFCASPGSRRFICNAAI
jgi:hypothetical protein